MVYVVDVLTCKILQKFEAWDVNCTENALSWIKENGYKPLKDEITSMGDMVIWVERR